MWPVGYIPFEAEALNLFRQVRESLSHHRRPRSMFRRGGRWAARGGPWTKGKAVKRSFALGVVLVAMIGVLAVPAVGSVDRNPNAAELVDVNCPDAGLSFETIWVASQSSVAGHDLEGNRVGVAKSLYVTDPDGAPVAELFHRPGAGLDDITVWCFWPDAESPSGFIGGAVLFNAHLRP